MQELPIINKKDPWPKGWGQKTSIMGVINLTPDSFSDGGELNSSKKVLDQVKISQEMVLMLLILVLKARDLGLKKLALK